MITHERPVVMNRDRIIERRIAGEAFARLPELFALSHADRSHQESIGFCYIANRLFCFAAGLRSMAG